MRSIGLGTRLRLRWIGLCALAALALASAPAAAQDAPDLREILPYLMLVIDTSGSMERLPACACTTPGCEECLPDCTLENVDGQPPVSSEGRQLKKNRWAVTLEALTGTFQNFECEALARNSANGATYDLGYYLPYHQPWDCETQADGTACAFDSDNSTLAQNTDGILDQYASRVRFGLMAFDGWDTYVGALPLVPVEAFDEARSNSVHGLWSYGGPKDFHYPGCDTDYRMDTGVRNETATEGRLISLNSCTGGGSPGSSSSCPSWCYSCDGAQSSINHSIQEALLTARPYGGTPIAASLEDLYYHLKNDVSDEFGGCRNRFALLVTDGYPDDDYRSVGCNCATANTGEYRCGGNPSVCSDPDCTGNVRYDVDLMKCPYAEARDIANDLVRGRSADGDPPMIERLFVVGLAVDDTNVLQELNTIATRGCTEMDCDPDDDGNVALFANDLPKLMENLSAVINSLIEPVSRSVPAFAPGSDASGVAQYQISTGFEISSAVGEPWNGVIERRRFTCDPTTHDLVEVALDQPGTPTHGDRFHDVLNQRPWNERRLWTVAPPGVFDWPNSGEPTDPDPKGWLYSGESGAPCEADEGCEEVPLAGNLSPLTFGLTLSDEARRNEIVNWMWGADGTPRETRRLGDIYHSSPVIMGAPRFDTADEAFNQFRLRTEIANRPLTLFVGSNDGILHAFSVEANSELGLAAGQEIWGFVPPLLLDRLEDNLTGHMFSMDGTPVVKNVYFNREPGQVGSADDYHTVLITGMRDGGNAYIALDVTDPINPRFLWQFTDEQMGKTFAQPAIAQATYAIDNGSGTYEVKEGAVAILPGGVGEVGAEADECDSGTNQSMRRSDGTLYKTLVSPTEPDGPLDHRSDIRCWRDKGRALYFVEVETGRLIKKLYKKSDGTRMFPSPLVSTPAIYQADIGTLTTKAFVVDADGVIWRIDMEASDPRGPEGLTDEPPYGEGGDQDPLEGWTARPFHDVFFDGAFPGDSTPEDAGELTYEAPILSVDNENRLVVIVATGDNNNFVKPTVRNRVVSLTEVQDVNTEGVERWRAAMNWEMRVNTTNTAGPHFVESELVTGPMGLFNGTLFFGSFISVGTTDACDVGRGRIHAVHYLARDTERLNDGGKTYAPLLVDAALDESGETIINVPPHEAVDNLMLMGLGLTQRPNCQVADTENFDVWGDTLRGISEVTDPAVYLVAQGSGDRSSNSLLQNRANSRLGSLELRVDRPSSLSRIVSWATSVD